MNDNNIFYFKKYFYALVLGVKLNMVICGFTMGELNWMKPRVRLHAQTKIYIHMDDEHGSSEKRPHTN